MCKKPHANARNHGEARLRTRKKAEDQGDDARHPDLRDPAVLLIDQLKEVYIDGELEVIDTTGYYPKIQRKDFTVGLHNQTSPSILEKTGTRSG
jgi:hypothetical protein